VEPVEINAGAWYLRGVRSDAGYQWDVCEPITGDVVAQVTLHPDTATLSSVGGNTEAVEVAEQAVRRFAVAALGITIQG
jgi:hypothetical protein